MGVIERIPEDRTEPVLEEIHRRLLERKEEEWGKLAGNMVQPVHREKHQHILKGNEYYKKHLRKVEK